MRISSDQQIERRELRLIICVTAALLMIIVVSIVQFRNGVHEGREIVGMLLPEGREDTVWSRMQYRGLQRACEQMGYDLLVRENIKTEGGECRQAVRELAHKGVRSIFLPSQGYMMQLQDYVQQYPRVHFFTSGVDKHVPRVTAYSLRYYEPRYLAGILAGMHTQNGRIGYLAPMQCLEINRGINAFALGVHRVNPLARVMVCWTGSWSNPTLERESMYQIRNEQVDVIAYHLDDRTVADTAEQFGIDYIGCYEADASHEHCLGVIEADWEKAYLNLLQGNVKQEAFGASTYWSGLAHDTVSFSMREERISEAVREQVALAAEELRKGRIIFSGEIHDNQGILRSEQGESISTQYMQTEMNWLVEGVEVVGSK